jgi:signal transduction histidine kinase/HD-like signal output (HDOD) protein
MVNSSFYGLPKRVTNIEHALVLLGTDTIKNIAVSASVYQAFKKAKDHSVFNLKQFWWHSLMCATLSKLIAIKTLYSSQDEAFLSGLLHDMGKLVLWVNFSKEYAQILNSAKDQPELLLAGEIQLGATHSEVGAWMINRWKLQSFLSDAVLYHHESTDRVVDALPLVKIIYVANVLSHEDDFENDVKFETAKGIFGFSLADVEEITLQAKDEVEEIATNLNIAIEPPEPPHTVVPDDDHEKDEELLLEVKDISLLQGLLQNLLKANDESSILKVVQQGLQILFDVGSIIFFVYDQERDFLLGKDLNDNEHVNLINEVNIPFEKEKTLLGKCLRLGIPLDSFSCSKERALTIIDNQIIRLIGKEGIVCLPMVVQRQYVGVIIIGMSESTLDNLYKQIKLLTMFTNQAAMALHANNLRQNQAMAIQSQRLTASSAIARKVVHEVNTPLSIIKNYLKILERKLDAENTGQEALKVINKEINRVALLLRELSDFSEPKVRLTDYQDINALLSDIINVFRESLLIGPDINVHLELEPSLAPVMTDTNRLRQVFMNLIQNASECMTMGGNIYIRTRYAFNDPEGKLLQGIDRSLRDVEITIKDSGPGISDNIKSRLFEPFTTSKGEGHAGLGLSIVYNIVRELNGTISCRSDSQNGTCFKIVLPVMQTQ